MARATGGRPGPRLRLGAERIIALLCLGAVLLYGWGGSSLDTALQGDVIGPAVFPAVLTGFGILLCIVLFVNGRPAPAPADATPHPDPVLPALVPAALLLGYALVFEWLGFLLATAVFLTVAFRYLGHPRWSSALIYSLVFTGGIFLVFQVGLGIKLPPGTLVPFG